MSYSTDNSRLFTHDNHDVVIAKRPNHMSIIQIGLDWLRLWANIVDLYLRERAQKGGTITTGQKKGPSAANFHFILYSKVLVGGTRRSLLFMTPDIPLASVTHNCSIFIGPIGTTTRFPRGDFLPRDRL